MEKETEGLSAKIRREDVVFYDPNNLPDADELYVFFTQTNKQPTIKSIARKGRKWKKEKK